MAKGFWDCHPKKCKSVEHGDYIVSCITKEDIQALKYIFKYKCSNAAQILDRFGRYNIKQYVGNEHLVPYMNLHKIHFLNGIYMKY